MKAGSGKTPSAIDPEPPSERRKRRRPGAPAGSPTLPDGGRVDLYSFVGRSDGDGRLRTEAERDLTSTVQTSVSPCETPSTVATAIGIEDFTASDCFVDRKTLVSNSRGIVGGSGEATDKVVGLCGSHDIGQSNKIVDRLHWPMGGSMDSVPYAADEPRRISALRILALEDPIVVQPDGSHLVRSETGGGYYSIRRERKGRTCTCKHFTSWHRQCKHIWALKIWLKPELYRSVGRTAVRRREPKPRDRHADAESRQLVEVELPELLKRLLLEVEEPARPVGRPGRNRASLRAQLFHAIMYAFRGTASEQFYSELLNDHLTGRAPEPGNYSTPCRVFNRDGTYELLLNLIELSALPLREIETGETIIVDSTGFSTTVRSHYSDQRYGAKAPLRYLKAHLIVGGRTKAVLAIAVTNERGADSPQFIPLVRRVVALGYEPAIAVADRAYTSKDAYAALAELGIDGYLPFKINMTGRAPWVPEMRRKHRLWMEDRAAFEEKYNLRSNIEAVNHAIKAIYGEGCLSKNPGAQSCEVLAKILVYNLRRLLYWKHHFEVSEREGVPAERASDPVALVLDTFAPNSTAPVNISD